MARLIKEVGRNYNTVILPEQLTTVAWASVTGTPTTVAGYGITDAITAAAATTGGQVAFFNGASVITSVSGLYFDGVDKLGIANASPSYNLDVTGTARITSNLIVDTDTLYVDATNNCVGIGTSTLSTEANLFLGAKGDEEGGQLVLQKANYWTYAAHIDNYQDNLRIMSGTNTASSSVKFNLDLLSGILNIGATFAASPSANGRLNVDASANQYSGYFLSSTTTGQSLGLYIQAGTNNADYSLIVQSATGTDYFYVMGDGDVRIPNGSIKTEAPSGGTAQPWKLGQYNATAPTATGYIEVEVNGTLYKLLAAT